MKQKKQTSILFVCMGNICRSPTAEGVFRKLVDDAGLSSSVHIDSAGTHAYHAGEKPDRRATAAAKLRGVDLTSQRARRVTDDDFELFDKIVAMDRLNLATLKDKADPSAHGRIRLLLEFAAPSRSEDVPDPYYGGSAGFEHVLDLVENAAEGLLQHIRRQMRE